MASVYGSSGGGSLDTSEIDAYLPLLVEHVELGTLSMERFDSSNNLATERVRGLLNAEIEGGQSWPFLEIMNEEAFISYYMTRSASFVVRQKDSGKIVGTFYIKSNFPGRCAGICNGGFIVVEEFRGMGIGKV
jgi:RimJ/RimL family protein N-acetyltransferase